MTTIAVRFPELTAALVAELTAGGKTDLAAQFETATVRGVTFDSSADAGYIYVTSARELNVVETNIVGVRHGETIPLTSTFEVYLDTDNFGRVAGVEILSPPAGLKALLRQQAAV
jgi:uncharacterized protein YuzE